MIKRRIKLFETALLTFFILSSNATYASDLRAASQNPISSLISVPLRFTYDTGATNGDAYVMNVNPVVPVTVGDWNLVSRAIIPMGNQRVRVLENSMTATGRLQTPKTRNS
jgi:hypothetical protein